MMDNILLKWLPVIKPNRCTRCGKCVEACGPACLEIINGNAVLTRPDKCGSEEHCIAPCSEKAIRMERIEAKADKSSGKWCILLG